jgi:hypothetical protein
MKLSALALAALLALTACAVTSPSPTNSATAKPALAMPGPLPDGTIELLAITYDHLDSFLSFGDDEFQPEVFGKWWWKTTTLSPSPNAPSGRISSFWWFLVALRPPFKQPIWPLNFVEPQTPWWTADGSPAPKFERNPLKPQHGGGFTTHSITYDFYFRTKTNPGRATWVLSGGGSQAWSFGTKLGPNDERKTPRGELLSDIVCFSTDVNWGAKSADLTVSVASAQWESIAKVGADPKGPGISKLLVWDKEGYAGEGVWSADNQSVTGNIRRGDAHWSLEMSSAEISDGDKRTHSKVTVIHNINTGRPDKPLEWDVRVIAIDQSGKEHMPDADSFGDRTLTYAFINTAYEFSDLPLAQAKEFILQVRPFQSQKFSHVALEPKEDAVADSTQPKPVGPAGPVR